MKKRNVFLTFLDGIYLKNPVFSLFLGLTLAVLCTTTLQNAAFISAIVLVDMLIVEIFISLFHKRLGKLAGYVIAALLSAAVSVISSMVLAAYYPIVVLPGFTTVTTVLINSLIPFVTTTSAVLIKGEEATERNVLHAFADALGSGIGFALALGLIALFREFIGTAQLQFVYQDFSAPEGMAVVTLTYSIKEWTWTLPAILNPFGGFLLTGFFSGIHACICHAVTDRKEKIVGGLEK